MADFPSIPFEEAVDALRRRGTNLFPSDHWAEVWQEQHQAGFTVARSAGFDILKDIHAELMKAMESGTTFTDFKHNLVPILQKKGWWGKTIVTDPVSGEKKTVQLGSIRRLQTIFDVNMRVSFAQGRWEQQQSVKEDFPYLRYEGILDSRIRPLHRSWHGTILPMDHPWWKTHYPPNGWRCRCDAVAISEDDLEENSWQVTDVPADGAPVTWVNPATGEVMEVPAGIDPGWAYNPGNTDQAAHLAKLAMDKLVDLPPSVGAAAIAELAFAFPQVEREITEWLEGIALQTQAGTFRPTGSRRVVGALDDDILAWLPAHAGVTPETAAITIADDEILHLLRTAKQGRGNALSVDDVKRFPSLLMNPDAVYWDMGGTGEQKRDEGLVYVWDTSTRGAGKIIVRVNFKAKIYIPGQKGRSTIRTNSIRSARQDLDMGDFRLEDGFLLIKKKS